MTNTLYSTNTPQSFWQVQTEIPPRIWESAITQALPKLGLAAQDLNTALELSLGEGQFGPDHWQLGFAKRAYYLVKPLLPRVLTRIMRKIYSGSTENNFQLGWPVESRYADFLWECMRQVLLLNQTDSLPVLNFWPEQYNAGFILTHDIETAVGQKFAAKVADLEQKHGFSSSFNFIPEKYSLDDNVIANLKARSFEVGVHGLTHDGKLFFSQEEFDRRASQINHYMGELKAAGFRAPLTHRNPQWMQALDMDYDLSFFDTDPYEPIPGGTMSLWPFQIGHFLELPYTLPQDYTLVNVLQTKTPKIWLDKVDFLLKYRGMVLLNTHPDYLRNPENWEIYETFLEEMSRRSNFWHALPCQAANWWRARQAANSQAKVIHAKLDGDQLMIE
ncbi:MAG: hypothetical protein K8R77_07625 [Anaerolineaceae bacterium]|nr:hypothetical protein [Anaerolineaceae bacterium]